MIFKTPPSWLSFFWKSFRGELSLIFLSLSLFFGFMLSPLETRAGNGSAFQKAAAEGTWVLNTAMGGKAISMLSSSDGWMMNLGDNTGDLAHWDGVAWSYAATITHTNPMTDTFVARGDIFMVSPTDGWAVLGEGLAGGNVDASSSIYRWNGVSWMLFDVATDLNSVSFSTLDMLSPVDGWAVAWFDFGGHYYHWDGTAWTKEASIFLPDAPANDIDMVSTDDGWAVGWGIAHWDGADWVMAESPVTETLDGIAMLSSSDGWIVGDNGVILHLEGNIWTQTSSPTTERLHTVDMLSSIEGWAAGDNGIILYWNGTQWTQVTSPATEELLDIEMISSTDGWITGWSGSGTLRYELPNLNINYPDGAPGSYFTITGDNFPGNMAATITINGYELGTTLTDENGGLEFVILTTDADEGDYTVNVSVNPAASVRFVLDAALPTRLQEGSGAVFEVPAGIAFSEKVYLPIVRK